MFLIMITSHCLLLLVLNHGNPGWNEEEDKSSDLDVTYPDHTLEGVYGDHLKGPRI